MFDITEIPGLLRLFSFKLAIVFDVFSRSPLAARVFLSEPSADDIGRLFSIAVRRFGAPRHSVSDRGAQFTAEAFRTNLARHGVRHRYGAIGRTGSIALIERFFRTLKALGGFRQMPASPQSRSRAEARLGPQLLPSGYDRIAAWREPPPLSRCSGSGPLTSTPSGHRVVGPAKPSRFRRRSSFATWERTETSPISSAKPHRVRRT